MRVLFKTIVGSNLYGLARPDSDIDYRGFGMPGVSEIIGLKRQEQDESKSIAKNTEGTIFSFNKYMWLLMKGNPTVFEIAFADKQFHIETDQLGMEVCEFARKNMVSQHVTKPYFAYFKAQRHELNHTKRTGKRFDLVQKYGYDTKFASHAVRLGYQYIDIATHGVFNPTLQGHQQSQCFAIKSGLVTLAEVNDILDDVDMKMINARENTKIPLEVNREVVDKFMVDIYYNFLKSELDKPA